MDFDFEWKEEYSVGVEEIDRQHRNLLAMIKKIYDIGPHIADKQHVERLLEDLVVILDDHFACEEEIMVRHRYPKLEEQTLQHRSIRGEVEKRIREIQQDQYRLLQLLFHLGRWFVDHDNNFDKELGRFLLRKGDA